MCCVCAFLLNTYIYTLIRNSNPHNHTHTYQYTLLESHVKIPTKSQRFFDCIFSIFDSFHFLNCLMLVVLQKKKKLHETQGLQSKFHKLAPSPTPRCSSYQKGNLRVPSTMVAKFTFIYLFIIIIIIII